MKKHAVDAEKFMRKLTKIDDFAADSIKRVSQIETQFGESQQRTLSKVTGKLCLDLTEKLNEMKSTLQLDLAQVTETATKNGDVVDENCRRIRDIVNSATESAQELSSRFVHHFFAVQTEVHFCLISK